jgi:hypothetical protein
MITFRLPRLSKFFRLQFDIKMVVESMTGQEIKLYLSDP